MGPLTVNGKSHICSFPGIQCWWPYQILVLGTAGRPWKAHMTYACHWIYALKGIEAPDISHPHTSSSEDTSHHPLPSSLPCNQILNVFLLSRASTPFSSHISRLWQWMIPLISLQIICTIGRRIVVHGEKNEWISENMHIQIVCSFLPHLAQLEQGTHC